MANREVDREGAAAEFAALLHQGEAPIKMEIGKLIARHGYQEKSVHDVVGNVRFLQAVEQSGVKVETEVYDSTKIYSMAGSEEQSPAMSTEELVTLIKQVKRTPVERDTLYNVITDYTEHEFPEEAKPQFYRLPVIN